MVPTLQMKKLRPREIINVNMSYQNAAEAVVLVYIITLPVSTEPSLIFTLLLLS